MAIRVGGQYIAVLFGLQLPLTRNLSIKVRGIFFKEVFARLLLLSHCVVHESVYTCIAVAYDYTTNRKNLCLSFLYRKTFKLKGNKKSRTWTKKLWVFFVFQDSYVQCIYIMNILCTFHISRYLAMVHKDVFVIKNTKIDKLLNKEI